MSRNKSRKGNRKSNNIDKRLANFERRLKKLEIDHLKRSEIVEEESTLLDDIIATVGKIVPVVAAFL
jgi:hypothetical protein